jgi:hypothetical protein
MWQRKTLIVLVVAVAGMACGCSGIILLPNVKVVRLEEEQTSQAERAKLLLELGELRKTLLEAQNQMQDTIRAANRVMAPIERPAPKPTPRGRAPR